MIEKAKRDSVAGDGQGLAMPVDDPFMRDGIYDMGSRDKRVGVYATDIGARHDPERFKKASLRVAVDSGIIAPPLVAAARPATGVRAEWDGEVHLQFV